MESLLALSGLPWSVPFVATSAPRKMSDPAEFSTASRRQNSLHLTVPKNGLHLLSDSTGIQMEGEREGKRHKHGRLRRRIWHKIHISVDEQTLENRAVGVTSSAFGDAPVSPDLLNQITPQEKIICLTADGVCDTRACHDAIAARGAVAVIPPRKNGRLWKPTTESATVHLDGPNISDSGSWRTWSGSPP